MSAAHRPLSILIAALGGEGGGVLTGWIVAAAARLGFPVQSTSIPGVAQRTGATTYYLELVPRPRQAPGDERPVLALAPGIGDVDVVLASELLEAGRAIAAGFVTADRTLLITSTARSYLVVEKMAMGDGRYDRARLLQAARTHAQAHLLIDMAALARRSGTMVNAVMLGVLAGCGRLPIPAPSFEEAIRADGKSVEANLRGFRAGLAAAQEGRAPEAAADDISAFTRVCDALLRPRAVAAALDEVERGIAAWPAQAHDILRQGVRRLAAYQDADYARLYLDRLRGIKAADQLCRAGGRLLCETARQLAVRMSYEDVMRVAQAKVDPARMARIAAELGVSPEQPFAVTEFLKPGIEEICSILPPGLARPLLAAADKRGWRRRLHWGMQVRTTSVSGFLRLWLLARLRRFRPRSYRYQEEQRAIEAWLKLIAEAAHRSGDLACEIAQCARLIKGYGDTLERGLANYRRIETDVILPILADRIPLGRGIDAVASARAAALADPEGEALARCLAEIEQAGSMPVAAE